MLSSHRLSTLYATGIALLGFSAVYRPEALGPLGASPGILLIIACVLALPLVRGRKRTGRPRIAPELHVVRLLVLGVFGSVVSLAVFGWSPLLAGKFVSLALLTLVWISPLLMVDMLSMRHLRIALAGGLLLCLLGYVLSDLFPGALPSAVRGLLFSDIYAVSDDRRPRGFTEEASSFSTTLARFALIYYLIWESGRAYRGVRLMAVLGGLALVLIALGSKGAAVGIAAAMFVASAGRKQMGYALLLLPAAAWTVMSQLNVLAVDLELYSSTSTRMGMALTGLAATLANPLGWGYYGFYGAVQHYGAWSMEWLSDQMPLLLVEMKEIVEDLMNVSTKSTLIDFSMTLGWAFIWLVWRIVRRVNLGDPRARAVAAYLLVTSLSTSGNASILFFLGCAVLMRLYPAVRTQERRQNPCIRRRRALPAPMVPSAAQTPSA